MSGDFGFNPMRWRCDERGCYNDLQRPRIEVFADCLPRRLAFTDIDATVEVGGRFLFLEFKGGEPRELPTGQRIYLERLTSLHQKITAVVVCGNAKTMDVRAIRVVHGGSIGDWSIISLDGLRTRIGEWADRADRAAGRVAA